MTQHGAIEFCERLFTVPSIFDSSSPPDSGPCAFGIETKIYGLMTMELCSMI